MGEINHGKHRKFGGKDSRLFKSNATGKERGAVDGGERDEKLDNRQG